MAISKKFLKSKPLCKVTFKLPAEQVNGAKKVELLGDFTNWQSEAIQMRKLKDGSFTRTVDLETGKNYEFRYLLDDAQWTNEQEADAYVPAAVGSDQNCVLDLNA